VTLAGLTVIGLATPSLAQPAAPDVCAILANRLQPDVLLQGTMSQQFSQIQQLVQDQKYQDFGSASASSSSFNLGFSIPDIVDLAIGDGQHSTSSNWASRRSLFLSMNFQQTSSEFKSSTYLSQTSVAAIHEIVQCTQTIANSKANGVFVVLDQVSPNRDSFAVKLTYRTDGDPNNWALTQFSVQPPDSKFNCSGFERASYDNKIRLEALTREIGCSKDPNAHLTLVVDTTQGGGAAIPLDSIDEEIQKLREDTTSQIADLSGRINKAMTDDICCALRLRRATPARTGVRDFGKKDCVSAAVERLPAAFAGIIEAPKALPP
jgi:hypothetical protein